MKNDQNNEEQGDRHPWRCVSKTWEKRDRGRWGKGGRERRGGVKLYMLIKIQVLIILQPNVGYLNIKLAEHYKDTQYLAPLYSGIWSALMNVN